ncbi:unnamed protein product [Echinostoma caproni]|uniref:VWFA domain-containing protein n=1 Tax=Echinostoma caproni TaxID=27848 RepID=A0A183B219_9TREM|nr:unnamed protein product [Echinostoma caproni]
MDFRTTMRTLMFLILHLWIFVIRTSYGYYRENVLTIGIIFDGESASMIPQIKQDLMALEMQLSHAVYVSLPMQYRTVVPRIRFELVRFSYSAICELLEKRIHVIISLCSCITAQIVTPITERYSIPYIVLLQDGCTLMDGTNKPIRFRLSIGPSAVFLAESINNVLFMERVVNVIMLSGGPSYTIAALLDETTQFYGTQSHKLRISMHNYCIEHTCSTVNNHAPELGQLLKKWDDALTKNVEDQIQDHYIIFNPSNNYLKEFHKVSLRLILRFYLL